LQLLAPGVVSHREEMIYMCTYSEKVRILQLIVSGTLANAGRPERVKNKTKQGVNVLPKSTSTIQLHINVTINTEQLC
jgi:hypothetical protein